MHLFVLKSIFGKKSDKTTLSLLWETPTLLIWLQKPLLVPSLKALSSRLLKPILTVNQVLGGLWYFFFNVTHLLSSFRDFSWFLVPKSIPFYFPALIWVYFTCCFLLLFLEVRKGGWSRRSACSLPTESPFPFSLQICISDRPPRTPTCYRSLSSVPAINTWPQPPPGCVHVHIAV